MYYLKPPSGLMSLEGLEKICSKRLEFLLQLKGCRSSIQMKDLVESTATVEGSDCLIEWTKKDRVSHFMLRLLCSSETEMTSTFVAAETTFFEFRFTTMTEEELVEFIKNTNRELRHININVDAPNFSSLVKNLGILKSIINEYDTNDLIKSYLAGEKSNFITMPFQFVTDLVARRLVIMSKGIAMVPCDKLHLVMKSLFREILCSNLASAKSCVREVVKDTRIGKLFTKLKAMFQRSLYLSNPSTQYPVDSVNFDEVDHLSDKFPLCMKHIHRTLRERHRLAHHSRVIYTLFLKEIGLTVHESIKFWKKEYSQPAKDNRTCSHGWQRDARRYTYSIRHLYGLEGSRINYSAHSCQSLQSMSLSPRDVAGCPYSHFDKSNLQAVLDMEDIPKNVASNICDLAETEQWSNACGCYFLNKSLSVLKKTRDDAELQCKGEESVSECLKETQEFLSSQAGGRKDLYPNLTNEFDSETEEDFSPCKKIKINYEREVGAGYSHQNVCERCLHRHTHEESCLEADVTRSKTIANGTQYTAERQLDLEHLIGGTKEKSCLQADLAVSKSTVKEPLSVCDETFNENISKSDNTDSCRTTKVEQNEPVFDRDGISNDVKIPTVNNCDTTNGAMRSTFPSVHNEFQGISDLHFNISKPADYFIAYKNLVDKLKCIG